MRVNPPGGTPFVVLLLGLVAPSCAPAAVQSSPVANATTESAAQASVSDRLYLGRAIPGGGTVSDAEWAAFLRDVVTPCFPTGLTVWRAEGQWRDRAGTVVREESFVLELIHPADAASDTAVREIIAEYKRRFRQESVMRVQDRVHVSF